MQKSVLLGLLSIGLLVFWSGCGEVDEGTDKPARFCPDGLVELESGGCAAPITDGDAEPANESDLAGCDDGEYTCSRNVLYYCIAGNWVQIEDCGTDSVCDAFEGKCVPILNDGDAEEGFEAKESDLEPISELDDTEPEVLEEEPEPEPEPEPVVGTLRITPRRDRALLSYDVVLHAVWESETHPETDVTDSVVWESSNQAVLQLRSPGVFKAVAPGTATVSAFYTLDGSSDSLTITVYERPQYEARGLWVTRWTYSSEQDVRTIIRRAASYGFNQVYFQIRGRADAFYNSDYEPWASELTGRLGQDPGWDPLEVAVEEAHEQGIELHAYINALTMWSSTTPPPQTSPPHLYHTHPEWIVVDSDGNRQQLNQGYIWISPGIPEVWDYLANIVEDIITKYNVDGIHLDRIRYPGPDYSYDEVSNQRFQEAKAQEPSLTRSEWQRRQVTELVRTIYERIQSIRPEVALSAATWGIYQRPEGWSSSSGYSDYFQDPGAWDELGIIDANIPMVYWHIRSTYGAYTDFRYLVDDHVSRAINRFVYIGSDFEDSSFSSGYIDASELRAQIDYVRQSGANGHVFFDYTTLNNAGLWSTFGSIYSEPAVVPFMPWKY